MDRERVWKATWKSNLMVKTSSSSELIKNSQIDIDSLVSLKLILSWILSPFFFYFSLGFKDCSRFWVLGHMPWFVGKSFGRPSWSLLCRFYRSSHCSSKSSVHSFAPSKASSCLVWTKSSFLSMLHWCFWKSGKCRNNLRWKSFRRKFF